MRHSEREFYALVEEVELSGHGTDNDIQTLRLARQLASEAGWCPYSEPWCGAVVRHFEHQRMLADLEHGYWLTAEARVA